MNTPIFFQAIVSAPGFSVGICCSEKEIFRIEYLEPCLALEPKNKLAREAARQICTYLENPEFHFDLPLKFSGTDFQRKVWQAIAEIPCHQSQSYGELAKKIGSAPRAVGQACGANPFPLVVPCHRVVAAKRKLGGFAGHEKGFYPQIKQWLLKHESSANS